MLLNVIRIFCVLLLIAALTCGLLGYQKLSQSWPLQDQAGKLFNEAYDQKAQGRPYEAMEKEGSDFATRAHDLRHPGELMLIVAGVLGGVGLLGLVLPAIVGVTVRTFRPTRTFTTYDDLIATEMREQLRPGEQMLNTAVVIRGWGRHWDRFCVVLTSQRLLLFAVRRSLLAGFQIMKSHQEEYDTDLIVGCATDQHWKGNDVIFQFPGHEMLLRLHFTGREVIGQRQFWEEVPARFAGRGPSPGQIIEEKLRSRLQK